MTLSDFQARTGNGSAFLKLAQKYGLASVPKNWTEAMTMLAPILDDGQLELVRYLFMEPEQFVGEDNVYPPGLPAIPETPPSTDQLPGKDNAPAQTQPIVPATPATPAVPGVSPAVPATPASPAAPRPTTPTTPTAPAAAPPRLTTVQDIYALYQNYLGRNPVWGKEVGIPNDPRIGATFSSVLNAIMNSPEAKMVAAAGWRPPKDPHTGLPAGQAAAPTYPGTPGAVREDDPSRPTYTPAAGGWLGNQFYAPGAAPTYSESTDPNRGTMYAGASGFNPDGTLRLAANDPDAARLMAANPGMYTMGPTAGAPIPAPTVTTQPVADPGANTIAPPTAENPIQEWTDPVTGKVYKLAP